MADNHREDRRRQFRYTPEDEFPQLCRQMLRPYVEAPPSGRVPWREAVADLWMIALERKLELVYTLTLETLQATKKLKRQQQNALREPNQ